MDYPIQTPDQLRQYIIGLRKKAGYSQEEAGALLGLTQQGYQRLERNPGNVSFAKIMRTLQVLEGTLLLRDSSDQANLVDESDCPPQKETGPGYNLTPLLAGPHSGRFLYIGQGFGSPEKKRGKKAETYGANPPKLKTPQKKASKPGESQFESSGNVVSTMTTKVTLQKNQGRKVDW